VTDVGTVLLGAGIVGFALWRRQVTARVRGTPASASPAYRRFRIALAVVIAGASMAVVAGLAFLIFD
jgi:hypothetical protein